MMKKLKIGALILAGLLVLIAVISMFLPAQLHTEQSLVISTTPANAYNQVRHLVNWEKWSPWAELDTNMKIVYGKDKEGRDFYSWEGNEDVMTGTLTVMHSVKDSAISNLLNFNNQFEAKGNWLFNKTDKGVEVIWSFDQGLDKPFIIGKYMGYLIKGELEKTMAKGLKKMKKVIDEMETKELTITEEEIIGLPIAYLTDSTALDPEIMVTNYITSFKEVLGFIKENELETAGRIRTITNHFSSSSMLLSYDAAVPYITKDVEPQGRIQLGRSYAGKVVKGTYYGPYMEISSTYNDIMSYIAENNLKTNGRSWEEFTERSNSSPEERITYIYFPIK